MSEALRSEEPIATRDDGDGRTLVLRGSVGIRHVATLHEVAQAALGEGRSIRVDWSGVEYIDSAALQVLVALSKSSTAAGACVFGTPSEPARAILRRTGLDGVLRPQATERTGTTQEESNRG